MESGGSGTSLSQNPQFHLKVKFPIEIPLYLIHAGTVREVVALGLHGDRPALDFFLELKRTNPKGHQILSGQIEFLCNAPRLYPRETFKLLDPERKIYEFRTRFGLRLYCFLDGDALVILTNGGKKNTAKEQSRDISRAVCLHDIFHQLKSEGAKPVIILP